MANRLTDSTSPYLLQHADNPVDWWPWCDEAFAEAQRRDVPVLLSVGYAACHWCHVMAHESFADQDIAELMNRLFVNIKVDREERPDIDAVYMQATQAMTGHGGWPMTCLLTPNGEPFHCGTYYPPAPRSGLPSFRQLLEAVDEAWTTDRDEIREAAGRVVRELTVTVKAGKEVSVSPYMLAAAVDTLAKEFNAVHGGFAGAPKFPPSMVMEFLLRHYERTGSETALSMVATTAEEMARGGIHDQLAGGFARYSVDAEWVVPHFEKMLYDNALLLRLYAHLARRTHSPLAKRVATQTAEFLLNSLHTTEGGFAAALDADTNGVEGLTYVWTRQQLTETLGELDAQWAADLLRVTERGTFEHGTSTLQLPAEPDNPERWSSVRQRLLDARMQRPQPARDDKIIAAWNGLTITGLAEAGVALNLPDWIEAAAAAANFLLDTHLVDGRLLRTSRHGVVGKTAGVLEDYACLASGLLSLHQVTGKPHWLEHACLLLDTALDRFAHPEVPGAFYDTADDAERLVQRPFEVTDNASPSGVSALADALLTASLLVGAEHGDRYRQVAESALSVVHELIARAPRFAGHWLCVAEALAQGPMQVAIVGEPGDPRTNELFAAAISAVHGGAGVVVGEPNAPGIPLLADRPLVANAPAAYVCRGYICDRPVSTPEALINAVSRTN